jgi:hypothetical protein
MRAEGLAQGELPAAAAVARQRRLQFRAASVRKLVRAVDAAAVSMVTIGLCFAAGIDFWHVPVATAAPYALFPTAGVAGVWIAGGYRFDAAGSILAHMMRVGVGAAAAMSAVFLLVLVFAPLEAPLFVRLGLVNGLALVALHGNYLGVVRTAARRGYLLPDQPVPASQQGLPR